MSALLFHAQMAVDYSENKGSYRDYQYSLFSEKLRSVYHNQCFGQYCVSFFKKNDISP
jgi:hypothetical protein